MSDYSRNIDFSQLEIVEYILIKRLIYGDFCFMRFIF